MRRVLCMVWLMACVEDARLSGPVFDARVERLDFTLEVRREIDLIIVVDTSARMAGLRDTLRANLPGFASVLSTIQGGLPDVQIGFVTDCDEGVLRAASSNGRFLVDSRAIDGSRMTNYEGELGEAMLATFDALPSSPCASHQPLATLARALAHPANDGFVREDAELGLVMLTANDDASPAAVAELAATIKARKRDPSQVSVGAALGPCRLAAPPISADPARRIRAFLAEFPNRSTVISLCQEDLSAVLQLFGELLAAHGGNPCFSLEIRDPPECSASIFVDDEVLVPACADSAALCWRIRRDHAQCPGGSHQLVELEHYLPSARRVRAVVECVVPGADML